MSFIDVDASEAVSLLDGIDARSGDLGAAVERVAEKALRSVSFTHKSRSGDLAGSLHVVPGDDGMSAQIVSDVFYSRFVFRGTQHAQSHPPQFHYSSDEFARDLSRELFGGADGRW